MFLWAYFSSLLGSFFHSFYRNTIDILSKIAKFILHKIKGEGGGNQLISFSFLDLP